MTTDPSIGATTPGAMTPPVPPLNPPFVPDPLRGLIMQLRPMVAGVMVPNMAHNAQLIEEYVEGECLAKWGAQHIDLGGVQAAGCEPDDTHGEAVARVKRQAELARRYEEASK